MHSALALPQFTGLDAVSPRAGEGRAKTVKSVTLSDPSVLLTNALPPYWDGPSHTGVPVGTDPPGPAWHSMMWRLVPWGRIVLAGTEMVMFWPLANGVPGVNGFCATAAGICWLVVRSAPAVPATAIAERPPAQVTAAVIPTVLATCRSFMKFSFER